MGGERNKHNFLREQSIATRMVIKETVFHEDWIRFNVELELTGKWPKKKLI